MSKLKCIKFKNRRKNISKTFRFNLYIHHYTYPFNCIRNISHKDKTKPQIYKTILPFNNTFYKPFSRAALLSFYYITFQYSFIWIQLNGTKTTDEMNEFDISILHEVCKVLGNITNVCGQFCEAVLFLQDSKSFVVQQQQLLFKCVQLNIRFSGNSF